MNKYVPEGAHWHSIMINDLDKSVGDLVIFRASPTIEEARSLLADELSGVNSDEDRDLTSEERDALYADMRAGKWDYMSGDTFCVAIYPCTGDDDEACKEVGDAVAARIVQTKTLSDALCTCPKHAARAAKRGGRGIVGLAGLLTAAAMFTTGDDPQTGMYL